MTRRVFALFAAFILLGLPEGVLGTAWPTMRADFARPEAALSQLLIGHTVGYLVGSAAVGRLVDRFGGETTTRNGIIAMAAGFATYLAAPSWPLALVASGLVGAGGGTVDASINAEIALRHGQRTMNLLHAAFGVGATLGPLLMTALLAVESGWRSAFAILLVAEVAVLGSIMSTRTTAGRGTTAPTSASSSDVVASTKEAATIRYGDLVARPRLVLAITLIYFAIYVAAEVSIGQWSYSILTEERAVAERTAGLAVAAYWGGLTAGRLALGVLGDRLHPMWLLRCSAPCALGGIIWFRLDGPGSWAALIIVGLAFSGIFPALVLMTSSWLPEETVTGAVGFQLAASSGGAILAAAVFGLLAGRSGLEATVTPMVVLVLLLLGVQFALERATQAAAAGT